MNATLARRRTPLYAASMLAVAACIAVQPAQAQDASEPPEDAEAVFAPVFVTTQRREQALNDVGISVTALTSDVLEDNNILDVGALSDLVPNLEVGLPSGPSGQPAIYLRGVGLNDFSSNNNGPVAVYIDDVYKSSIVGQNFLLYDVDRLEVVKGPQGTLYGRNATGGAVRIITAKPADTLQGDISASYADFGTTRIDGMINLPLSDTAALRIAAVKADSDGYIRNTFLNRDVGAYDTYAARAQLSWDLSPDLNLLLSLEDSGSAGDGPAYSNLGLLDPATGEPCTPPASGCTNALGQPIDHGDHETSGELLGKADNNVRSFSGVLTWDVGNVTLSSVTAYDEVGKTQLEDSDATPVQLVISRFRTDSETFSQEFRLNHATARSDLTAGLFYLSETLDQDQFGDLFRELRPLVESVDPVAYPGGFDPGAEVTGAPILRIRNRNSQETETYALFGQYEYDLSDEWRATIGGRVTKETRDIRTSGVLSEPTFEAPIFDLPLSVDDTNFSWKAGLDWRPNADTLLYGSVSTGFKSGGFNGGFLLDPAQAVAFDPETITAYELGIKATLPAARMQANAAVFFYDYTDIQVFTFINSGGVPTSILSNAGEAEILGFEADLLWKPSDSLSFNGAIGLLDTEFVKFSSDATLGTADFAGNTMPFSPELSLTAGANYHAPISRTLEFSASMDASYQSEVWFDPSNAPLLGEDGYGLLNASIGIGEANGQWTATLFATNLTDEAYNAYAIDLSDFGFIQYVRGAPRTVGIRLGASF